MFNHLNKYTMSKKTVIKLEAPSKDGYETYMMDADHASNILRMSKERGWGWRLPEDSEWEYNESDGTFVKRKLQPIKSKEE